LCTSVSCFDLWWFPCGTILFEFLLVSCSMLWEKMIVIWYHLTWYVIYAVADGHAGSGPVVKTLYLRILSLEYVGYRFEFRYKMIVCWIQKPKNFDQYYFSGSKNDLIFILRRSMQILIEFC
jgi:hypothetical protein